MHEFISESSNQEDIVSVMSDYLWEMDLNDAVLRLLFLLKVAKCLRKPCVFCLSLNLTLINVVKSK